MDYSEFLKEMLKLEIPRNTESWFDYEMAKEYFKGREDFESVMKMVKDFVNV